MCQTLAARVGRWPRKSGHVFLAVLLSSQCYHLILCRECQWRRRASNQRKRVSPLSQRLPKVLWTRMNLLLRLTSLVWSLQGARRRSLHFCGLIFSTSSTQLHGRQGSINEARRKKFRGSPPRAGSECSALVPSYTAYNVPSGVWRSKGVTSHSSLVIHPVSQ